MNGVDKLQNMKNKLANTSTIQQTMKSVRLMQIPITSIAGLNSSSSAVQQAIKSAKLMQTHITSVAGLNSASPAVQQAIKSVELMQTHITSVAGLNSSSSAAQQAIKSAKLMQTQITSVAGLNSASPAVQQARKSAELMQTHISSIAGLNSSLSAVQQAIKSTELMQTHITSVAVLNSASPAVQQAIKSAELMQTHITSVAGLNIASPAVQQAMSNSASIFSALESFQKANAIKPINTDFLNNLASSINELRVNKYSDLNENTIASDLESATNALDNNDSKSFFEIFKKLPQFVQLIIASFFVHIFIPHLNSISANLLTPTVNSLLSQGTKTNREKIKEIKNLPRKIEVDTSNLRFITGNNVRLRAKSSTNSSILDEMELGQIVFVHSKNKNWIEISYKYEDGTVIHGWVFTRYTKRFVNFK